MNQKIPQWKKAAAFAKKKHAGHLDDSGRDYFAGHLSQVADLIRIVTDDDDVLSAAYLHDTLEDTDTTYEELEKEFGPRIAGLVHEVTQEGRKDSYGFYFPRLKSQEAIMIKFADRLSNLSRMDPWNEKRRSHYLKRSTFWKSGEGKK